MAVSASATESSRKCARSSVRSKLKDWSQTTRQPGSLAGMQQATAMSQAESQYMLPASRLRASPIEAWTMPEAWLMAPVAAVRRLSLPRYSSVRTAFPS